MVREFLPGVRETFQKTKTGNAAIRKICDFLPKHLFFGEHLRVVTLDLGVLLYNLGSDPFLKTGGFVETLTSTGGRWLDKFISSLGNSTK